MNVFEVVKENVTARQAAEAYGLKVGRTGMACCPFHSDKSPSMKVKVKFFAPRQIQRRLFAALITLSRKVF